MSTPTRLPNGLSTEKNVNPLGNFPLPNRNTGRICSYENDFVSYNPADFTETAGGAGSGSSLSLTNDSLWGLLTMLAATSGVEALVGAHAFNFNGIAPTHRGLQTWFRTRVTLDATVANPDYLLGLTKGSMTTFNSATDGVYFTKASGATTWSFNIRSAATGLTTTVALPGTTPVNGSTIDLAYYFDGRGMFYIFFNEVCIGTYGSSFGSLGSLGSDLSNLPASTILLAATLLVGRHTADCSLVVDCLLAAVETTR